jgi:preprotein translocase subunit YajC
LIASACRSIHLTRPIFLAADVGASEGLREFLVLFLPLFVIWYFLVIMPQQRQRKRTQQMLANLKAGDRVLTSGGIYGTIVGFREDIVQIQVANQVKLDVARSAVSGVQADATGAEAASGAESAKRQAGKGKG